MSLPIEHPAVRAASDEGGGACPELSLLIPALNEEENVPALVAEIERELTGRIDLEVLWIDDGSRDGTVPVILSAMRDRPHYRLVRHRDCAGKSAALRTGALAARAPVLATIDADMQNPPAAVRDLWAAWRDAPAGARPGLVAGQRGIRQDNWMRRISSRVANRIRARLLRDGTRDTACGLKLIERELMLALPVFEGMHRFLPALVNAAGRRVAHVDVDHRPRAGGIAKYGLGNRLWVGIADMLMVWWLTRRMRHPDIVQDRQDG